MGLTKQSEIFNYKTYTDRMHRSVMDKLFFVSHVNKPKTIVDFGCANGVLIDHLLNWFPETKLVGYDIDNEMIKKCREKISAQNTLFSTDWDEILETKENPSVLVLSSIIHEVYHYFNADRIDKFWDKVWGSGFDYIVLRDMIPSRTIDRKPSMNDVAKVHRNYGGKKPLEDFEATWGRIDTSHKNLVHFLLKYRYTEPNWDREVKENYIPIYIEDLLSDIPADYDILYQHTYVLPFLKQKIRDDFGIELQDSTHTKLILENNGH